MEAFRRQFEQLSAEADLLVTPLGDELFNRRPSPDRWSVAECIEHLNVSARRYLPAIDEGIAAAVRLGLYGAGPFTYNWLGRVFVWTMEPPPRFKAKAPSTLRPEAARPKQDVLSGFRAYQVQYIDRLHAANGLDLARARVRSPVASWLRIPLGSAFQLMAAHERRHLWQARQALDALRG
jgi:hypothetical protein